MWKGLRISNWEKPQAQVQLPPAVTVKRWWPCSSLDSYLPMGAKFHHLQQVLSYLGDAIVSLVPFLSDRRRTQWSQDRRGLLSHISLLSLEGSSRRRSHKHLEDPYSEISGMLLSLHCSISNSHTWHRIPPHSCVQFHVKKSGFSQENQVHVLMQ